MRRFRRPAQVRASRSQVPSTTVRTAMAIIIMDQRRLKATPAVGTRPLSANSRKEPRTRRHPRTPLQSLQPVRGEAANGLRVCETGDALIRLSQKIASKIISSADLTYSLSGESSPPSPLMFNKRNRSSKRSRKSNLPTNSLSLSPEPEQPMDRVFIWDLDEAVVMLNALLNGKFAPNDRKVSFKSAKNPRRESLLGEACGRSAARTV